MSEGPEKHLFTFTQRDVANIAVSISSTAVVGATAGSFIAPGPGTVVGTLLGGLTGLAIERFVDRKVATQPSEISTNE